MESARQVPHSTEAERAVLGGLMLDPERIHVVNERLSADDFYREAHSRLYTLMAAMAERSEPTEMVAVVEAVTTIHVTSGGVTPPVHVALLTIGRRRVFARLDQPLEGDEPLEQILAGQKVRVLVKDDGDHYFQLPQSRGLDLGRISRALRRRVGPSEETKAG